MVNSVVQHFDWFCRFQDQKSVESVCLALSRLVDSLQSDPSKLMQITNTELLTNLQQLVSLLMLTNCGSSDVSKGERLQKHYLLAIKQRNLSCRILTRLIGSSRFLATSLFL